MQRLEVCNKYICHTLLVPAKEITQQEKKMDHSR